MSSRRLSAVGDRRGTVHRKKRAAVAWQRRWQGTAKAVARQWVRRISPGLMGRRERARDRGPQLASRAVGEEMMPGDQ
ncbi:hypothetical protein GW17_00034437 [Ensete ventricosum]|nr:hypothetical protein GW17_00034437 [Ensete ventricosum]